MSISPQEEPTKAQSPGEAADGPKRVVSRRDAQRSQQHTRDWGTYSHGSSHGRRRTGIRRMLFAPWRSLESWWIYWMPTRTIRKGIDRSIDGLLAATRFRGRDFEQVQEDGYVVVRTWPSRGTMLNPLWWFSSAGQFIWRWVLTRPYLPMALAAPGVLGAMALMAILATGGAISDGSHSSVYKRMLSGDLASMDMQQARLALDALIHMDPNSLTLPFDRAVIEAKLGKVKQAREVMAELAVAARSQPAAMWLAGEVGDPQQLSTWTQSQVASYYRWLDVAIQNAPEDPFPRRLIADLKRISGDKEGAYKALLPIADIDLPTSYLVYFLQKDLGLGELARTRSDGLKRAYRLRLDEQPADINSRVQYAFVLAAENQLPEAKSLLDAGLAVASTPEALAVLRRTKCELLVQETRKTLASQSSPRQLVERFAMLKEAMAIDPTNPSLIDAITQACLETAESKNNELLVLRESLVQNIDPDTSHFILGTLALYQGKIPEATQHLELAARNNPKLPGLLNNLAHAISHGPNPDLPRALRIINAGLASMPDHPFLRETRGQIYLQLKQYTDAIADLEVALDAPELRAQVREGLAQAYEASGQPEIAKRQRDLGKKGR